MKKIPCEVYSRVVGYLRPVNNWLPAKQQEFKDRKVYKLEMEEGDGEMRSETEVPARNQG